MLKSITGKSSQKEFQSLNMAKTIVPQGPHDDDGDRLLTTGMNGLFSFDLDVHT